MTKNEIIEALKNGKEIVLTVADNNNDITIITMDNKKLDKRSVNAAVKYFNNGDSDIHFTEASPLCDSIISYSEDYKCLGRKAI